MSSKDCSPADTIVSGPVKWFSPEKGFGFVLVGNPGRDAFVHCSVVEAFGTESLVQGDRISCLVENGPKGLQVRRITEIKSAVSARPDEHRQFDGKVKFFRVDRGYGFISDDRGNEVFVGSKLLKQLGLAPLREDQPVRVSAVRGQRGWVAETLTFLASSPVDP